MSQSPTGFLFNEPHVTLGVRGSFNLRQAHSELFDFVTDSLTLSRGDFDAFGLGAELGVRVSGPVDLVLEGGYNSTSKQSEFRNYVDENDLPITQRTTLETVPLIIGARMYLAARGRQIGRFVWIPSRVLPYVGIGVGAIRYSFNQSGSFVDFQDFSIFGASLRSTGWAPLGAVSAGADYSLGTRVFLNADLRYLRANGELGQDFARYSDGIDLSGLQFSAGIHVRL